MKSAIYYKVGAHLLDNSGFHAIYTVINEFSSFEMRIVSVLRVREILKTTTNMHHSLYIRQFNKLLWKCYNFVGWCLAFMILLLLHIL